MLSACSSFDLVVMDNGKAIYEGLKIVLQQLYLTSFLILDLFHIKYFFFMIRNCLLCFDLCSRIQFIRQNMPFCETRLKLIENLITAIHFFFKLTVIAKLIVQFYITSSNILDIIVHVY